MCNVLKSVKLDYSALATAFHLLRATFQTLAISGASLSAGMPHNIHRLFCVKPARHCMEATHIKMKASHTLEQAHVASIPLSLACLLACLLAHAACLAFGCPSTTNLLPNLLALMHNHYNTCMLLAAAEAQEPYPTTEALLEKLQEVLEKADVEVCSLQAVHHAIAMSHWHTSAPQIVCSCACFHHQ